MGKLKSYEKNEQDTELGFQLKLMNKNKNFELNS